MRVPGQQPRTSRSKPPISPNKRAKNKRGAMSEVTSPAVKIKKRKLQPLVVDPPNDAASPTTGVATAAAPKRKPGKKVTVPGNKKAEPPGKGSVVPKKLTAKKSEQKVLKVTERVTKKAPPPPTTTTLKKTPGKLIGKKATGRRPPDSETAATPSAGEIGNNADAVVSEGLDKKSPPKKVKVIVNKAKAPRVKKVKDTALSITRKKTEKDSKRTMLKSSKPTAGMKRRLATTVGKKTRRKPSNAASDVASGGESVPVVEPAPVEQTTSTTLTTTTGSCTNHQLQVIDGVARNVIKGGFALAKKAKDNESCVIKGKASIKNKKPLGKKTPKNASEEITKSEGVIESEIGDGVNAAVKKADKTVDKELCPSAGNTKTKVVVKKKLKEAEKEINTKKIAPKKTSVKAVKLVSKVVRKPKVASGKVKKILTTKKKLSKREKRSSSELSQVDDDDDDNAEHSSTSDEFTLDLLLQRQKQVKAEVGLVKSEVPDVKPRLASLSPSENIKSEASSPPTSPAAHVKGKLKVKAEAKNCDLAKSSLKKKFVKKALVSKLKTKTAAAAALKKQNPMLAKRLKLAAACKTKVKRIRPTEVTKLAGGGSGSDNEQRARRIKLFGFWSGPKRHRVASLNALAKVHCLYENESRSALLSVCTKPPSSSGGSGAEDPVVEVEPATSTRTLRSGPGRQGVGKHWDQQTSSSTSSSEDNAHSDDCAATLLNVPPSYKQKQDSGLISKKPMPKPVKKVKKPRRREVIMDLKDMVVRKRMASLNASAILSASYSVEKPKKTPLPAPVVLLAAKEPDSPRLTPITDEEKTNVRKKKCKKKFLSKQIVDDDDTDDEVPSVIEKVATVIVNQDTDVTITGVYVNSTTHRSSTTHEGYCSIAGMQYRISSTSHTQTEATAVATETLLHAAAPDHVAAPEPPTQPLKSYTPLGALSNMQPPGGPLSPLGRRHGCNSAFTAPPNVQPPPPPPPPPPHHHHHHPPPTQGPQEPPPPYMHGYYQPAGPLISAHHHHGLPKPSVLPPLEASPTPTPPTLAAASSSGTRGGDESSDNDVVITATSCSNQAFNNSPISHSQHPPASSAPPTYRYPPNYPLPPTPQHVHHQYPYSQYPQQYYPAGVQAVQYSGAPPPPPPQQHYHHSQDMCYSAPSYPPAPPYYHHKTYSTPPPVSYPRRYGPPGPPHPSQYYSPELYAQGTEQQAPSRQMVATASTSGGGYQPPVESYPPPPTMVDPYPPPPPPPPTGYYTGYPPAPSCYQHSPPARSLAFIDTAYQGCPCPMQSCPKNVHTGPLTGDGKGPDSSAAAATFHQLPLPPVALALPLEPPNAMGPPSPARGSAGMHPPPSPLATAQGNNAPHYASKQEPFTAHLRQDSETAQDLSSKNVGLLTIHKPPEPTLTVLQTISQTKHDKSGVNLDNNIQAVLKCDIEPKHQHAKVNRLDMKEQQTVDFSKMDPKVERNVKVEVGSFESEAAPADKTARKRKMKMENVSLPKPKKRNVTTVKRVPVNSKQFSSGGDNVSVKIETPAQRKSKNQPLSSANSCSLHHSKQNAKKRKLSDAKDLSENQEPAPVVSKRKSVEEKAVKEPKSRPKLCTARTQTTKAKSIKPTKKAAAISEQLVSNICESNPTNESASNVVILKPIDKEPATIPPVANTTSGAVSRKKPTKAQLTKIQHIPNTMPESSGDVTKINGIVNRKKLQPKSLLNKIPPTSNGIVPITTGKVQRRRQTDSDAIKVSHMLRSHGMQEPRPAETERMTNNSKSAAILPQALALPGKSKLATIKKQTGKNGFTQSMELVLSQQLLLKKGNYLKPKWSNGWSWEGEAFQAKVHLNSEETGVERRCYPAMRHNEGDIIRPRDCILLKSGPRKMDLPFVAKVAQLWENPEDGEMMVSLLWYYRPEHTDNGRRPEDMPDEIFASKHKDTNSVACIEDKCYVLTFNEYCRYRAGARRLEEGMRERSAVVPQHEDYPRLSRQPTARIAPDMVFFCRRVYDFRQKRILKNPG